MTRIVVESPGLQTTVQDLGRPGWAHLGVSTSGAADPLALRAGNRLLGNPDGAPALEMPLFGGSFRFDGPACFAITGGDFEASLSGQPVGAWQPLNAASGARLEIGRARRGARAYLCVAGGLQTPRLLGSASTHVTSGVGGPGRALRAGDEFSIGSDAGGAARRNTSAPGRPAIDDAWLAAAYTGGPVRIVPGPQFDWFQSESRDRLAAAEYHVLDQSNRMGLRLAGDRIVRSRPGQLLTEGTPVGAVQVPDDGQPIVLFVEHGTTGGYPKIAAVCAADLHRLGQLRPRDTLRFQWIEIDEAHRLLRRHEELLARIGPEVGR